MNGISNYLVVLLFLLSSCFGGDQKKTNNEFSGKQNVIIQKVDTGKESNNKSNSSDDFSDQKIKLIIHHYIDSNYNKINNN
jgi:hypothetical protein